MAMRYAILWVVLVLTLLSPSCSPLRPEAFGPGDIIGAADGMSISLEKAQVSGSKLTTDFILDNTHGTQDQTISAAVNFSAKDADGNLLALAPCAGPPIDQTVLAGEQIKGQVCWQVTNAGAALEIYFDTRSGDARPIVWAVD